VSEPVVWPGDAVEEGDGPVRCSGRRENGRLCGSVLGWPEVGGIVVERVDLERGEKLEQPCEEGVVGLLCTRCRSVTVVTSG
jgi:hypothetical protein